jgi:hypothetical protein
MKVKGWECLRIKRRHSKTTNLHSHFENRIPNLWGHGLEMQTLSKSKDFNSLEMHDNLLSLSFPIYAYMHFKEMSFEKSKWKLCWKTFQSLRSQFERVKFEMKSLTKDWKALDKSYKIYTCKFDLCLFHESLAFKIARNQCVPISRKNFRNEYFCQFCNWNVTPMDTCRI